MKIKNKKFVTVEKIGGTSMSRFDEVLTNIILKKENGSHYNRIFIVSAYSNITNLLLEHKKTGEDGLYTKFVKQRSLEKPFAELLNLLKEINNGFKLIGLDVKKADDFIEKHLQDCKVLLEHLRNVFSSGYVNKENILLAAREILASIGEAHSAFNSANIVKNNGINATLIDLSGINDNYYYTIDQRIKKELKKVDLTDTLPFVTGYTKGTEGIMREFDRGYSEVTFSKIVVLLKAREAIIHKEFHLSSADPKIVGIKNSIPVCDTNFDVADQLADIGMEAIHPKVAKPIEQSGIPIRIKNVFDPKHSGTLISKDYVSKTPRVEIITGSDKVVLLEIFDPLMVGSVGFDLSIMQIFKEYNVSYITKTTNANSICFVVWEKDIQIKFITQLKRRYHTIKIEKVSMLCIIGSSLAKPGVLAHSAKALYDNNINIICVAQASRQVNVQFVIENDKYEKALKILHRILIEKNKFI